MLKGCVCKTLILLRTPSARVPLDFNDVGNLSWHLSDEPPKLHYTAAHLKTREQRRVSYYSQLARAQSPQAVVDVHRGLIGKALAERWFLPLAL